MKHAAVRPVVTSPAFIRHVVTRRQALLGLGALSAIAAGCGGGGSSSPAPAPAPNPGGSTGTGFAGRPMLENIVDRIIVPTYKALDTSGRALLIAAQALKAVPDAITLKAAQDAWKATRKPWEQSEGFLYGPVTALTIDPAIDSWPLDTAALQGYITQKPNATKADIDNAPDNLRGFHAIEYLLFGDGATTNTRTVATITAAEMNMLTAQVESFNGRTAQLADAWSKDFQGRGAYAELMKKPSATSPYPTIQAVVQEIVGGLTKIVEEVGNNKMQGPMGAGAGAADTSKVESQYSWNSLTDFHDNIQSVMNVYSGVLDFNGEAGKPTASGNGIYAFVAAKNPALADRVFSEIDKVQQSIALIKGDGQSRTTAITGAAKPFRTQISDATGRALITTAINGCVTLAASLKNEVQPLVAQATFSDN